jgi:hypothetical protein
MKAASPGVIATITRDAFYGSPERYVRALVREMRKEYALIVERASCSGSTARGTVRIFGPGAPPGGPWWGTVESRNE